jgi:hypothetical protein
MRSGPAARERHRESLKLFAAFIREPDGRPPAELLWSAHIGVVYAARQLASDALDETSQPDLVRLGADLEIWLSDLFRRRWTQVARGDE